MSEFPKWTWADLNAMRVEVAADRFVDYARCNGVWRQQTREMSHAESVEPTRCWIGEWRAGSKAWPVVDEGDSFARVRSSSHQASRFAISFSNPNGPGA